jgi:hypothetical protein
MPNDLHEAAHVSLDNRLQALERAILDLTNTLGRLEGRVLTAAAIGSVLAGLAVYFIK